MVTVCASKDTLALLLSEEELRDVRAVIRFSLEAAGLEPWHDLEAELFMRPGGGMLLARPRPPLLTRGAFQKRARRKR